MLSQRSIGAAVKKALPSDDEFNTVSFLSHFDGDNNGVNNVFDDSSSSNHTITASGNVTQGSFGPFARPDGEWGVDYTASTSSWTKVNSDGTNLAAGTGAYTVESWINWTEWAGTNQRIWLLGRAGTDFIVLGKQQNENRLFTKADTIDYDFTPVLGQWYHIALVRASTGTNGLSLYIDGVRVAQGQDTYNVEAEDFYVSGLDWASGYALRGHASNFRYTKSAVYSGSSFTVPTEPLSAIANTEILMCQSNRFVDNSVRGRSILTGNGPTVSAFGPFLTSEVYDAGVNGASAYLQDSGYLSFAESSDFDVGTGDFTIECSLYYAEAVPSGTNYDYIWGFGTNTTTGLGLFVQGGLVGIWNNSYVATGSTTVKQGEWTTLAVVRSGSTLSIYQNGVRETTATLSSDITTAGNGGSIGGWINVDSINIPTAYITDFRFVNGTALRSGASYTVPTAPLTAITNTKLLLNMADGQAIDSAAQNNLTLVGDAKISSTQSKFGGTSLALDGTGDYAFAPHNSIYNLSGDFTVELWAYISSNNTTSLIGKWDSSNYAWIVQDLVTSLRFYTGDSGSLGTQHLFSWSRNLNQWYHIAITRSGTTVRAFQDGVLLGTGTNSDNLSSSDSLNIGYNKDGNQQHFNGYLDDVRITNGVARYTSAFTPPTEPFPDKGQET